MIKKILTPIATIAMVASVQNAEASNLYRAKALVQQAVNVVASGRPGRGGSNFYEAQSNLTQAKSISQGAPYSRAKNRLLWLLDDAIYAAGSRTMPPYEKSQVITDRGNQAIDILDRMIGHRDDFGNREELDDAMELMDVAWAALKNGNEHRAQGLLTRTIGILDDFRYDYQITQAIRNIREIQQLIDYSRHNGRRALERIKQLGQEAKQLIRSSRAYQSGGHGGMQQLGSTGKFSSRYASTETLYPRGHSSVVSELFVTAGGSSVEIQSIEITYGNGQTQYLGYAYLGAGQKLGIHLQGGGRHDRRISMIRVTARSAGSRYSRAQGHLVFTGK